MTRYVIDTSVVCAWYLPELFSQAAREWRSRMLIEEAEFVVPDLHYWELGNVLRTYVRRNEIEADLAREIYGIHLEAPLVVVNPVRGEVLKTALAYEATMYDAVFIRLSLELGLSLITAERTTTPWVTKLGNQVIRVG
jgi:predicted nucleic acid-binding protein